MTKKEKAFIKRLLTMSVSGYGRCYEKSSEVEWDVMNVPYSEMGIDDIGDMNDYVQELRAGLIELIGGKPRYT